MKLTALDIRQKTFEKSFRGVDKDEVQAFLTTVSQHWERMSDENRELRLKLEHAQHDVQKMREVESSLYRTLKTAEDTSTSITEQAQRDADLRVREAQFQAEQLVNEARQRARGIVDEAYQQAEKAVADMQREVGGLGQECQRLEQHLDSLVRDLHNLASDALEKVDKARSRPGGGTAAILSRAASVKVERPKESAPEITEPMPTLTAPARPTPAPVVVPTPLPEAPLRATELKPQPEVPTAYNPKPGQQPDPGAPAQTPEPEIERPEAPAENPGISPAPHIDPPAPSQVPDPAPPRVEPPAPDIRPIMPDHPEIAPPVPPTHPGQPSGPAMAAEVAAAPVVEPVAPVAAAPAVEPVAATEKSFFDEI
ncbi:DivIVA domain-containing protein [Hymenobacter sp. ASUV-10]|uniref:DivIVA domain-containing protein n=1 Tax=Hymenobacter aranciens TaxID=3063996 RepID=A0ABT9BEC9_9BACT|nr:DivIVA domain-containing protein [Hymenobacter sp. ASUV-10]MDO7876587.1 DivIVA domain-containing protein [Hymenobacter sp. ASUV-10]